MNKAPHLVHQPQDSMKPSGQEEIQYFAGQRNDFVNCQELEKANLVINQFIKSCSHSMRSPLKSIRGLVNILKERNSDTAVDPVVVLKFIEESTDKMETMLDELEQFMLNSSKETNRKSVDLEELIFRVTTSYQ
jgi:light-regulated signal transduction histidine kinase (bacteriophytochrome)